MLDEMDFSKAVDYLAALEWQWPYVLALLPLPILVRWLMRPAPVRRDGALKVPFFADLKALPGGGGIGGGGARRLTLSVMALAWLALVLAAARPQWVGPAETLPTEGRDLMLAVDLSGSMAQEDFTVGGQPIDRLTIVRHVAKNFVDGREGDRVGLVLFGSRAYLQTPLTADRDTVKAMLDESVIGLAGQETAIGDAIGIATKRLKDREGTEQPVLILLTDGASNAGVLEPRAAAALAAEAGIRIYTIGVGADRVGFGGGTALDEATLNAVAEATGGRYFRARDARTLVEIYDIIDRLEKTEGEPTHLRPTKQLFYWPLGIALALAGLLAAARLAPVHRLLPAGNRNTATHSEREAV